MALVVLFSFPASIPTDVSSMNYSSVVLVGLLAVLVAMWLVIGKNFEGPKADLEKMNLLGVAQHNGEAQP